MTRLTPQLTNLKIFDITYPKQETLLDTPETLPTSEPSTPQIGYTVQESDLPALNFYKKIWVAFVFGAGKFPTAGTLYWRMKKNGSSVATSSASVSTNYYYTVNAFFYDVKVGDVLELALWSNVSDSNWDYKALSVLVTRIIPIKIRLLKPCTLVLTTRPVLSLGNPSVYSTDSLRIHHDDFTLESITASKTYNSLYFSDTAIYGLCRIYNGDINYPNNAVVRTSASYRPYYHRNYVPSQIKLRGVRID